MRAPDDRPFYALGAGLLVLALALAVPAARVWLAEEVGEPLRAQADPAPGLKTGYTLPSLAAWAALGGLGAWAAFELVFVRLRVRPDARFFLALAPLLLLGPTFHALLAAGAFPAGSVLAYLAAEPLVYLTIAGVAVLGLLLGRLAGRAVEGMAALGAAALLPALVLMGMRASAAGAWHALLLVGMALACALPLAWAFGRLRPVAPFPSVLAVVGAHALDGATTWMVLRDPFGLGFVEFGEKNPVSRVLVEASNGWPYFALKLALPLVLLSMVKREEGDEDVHAFLLFAVFVLGFGPGMSNLLQVLLA